MSDVMDDELAALLKVAKEIAARVAPKRNPEFACMLVAAAVAGMRGLGMRNLRIGALFYPDKFEDDPYLSMRGGWGCDGFSQRDGLLYLADETVDEDGGFCGHTWIEPDPESVFDPMHGICSGMRDIYDAESKVVGRYIPRRALERAVKMHWRAEMNLAIKSGKEMAAATEPPSPK